MAARALAILLLASLDALPSLAAEPTRVATLLPSIEDALGSLPPEKVVVVATVRRDLHQAPNGDRIDLGNAHSPSFEKLAEARPDLVVGDAQLHAMLGAKLERSGAEVMLVDTTTVDKTFDALHALAARVGAQPEMERQTAAARAKIDALGLQRSVPVLAIFGAPGSFYAVTDRTWLGDLLARLNFHNVGSRDDGNERFPGLVALSDEVMATLRPELVLLMVHGDPQRIRESFTGRMASGGPWSGMRDSATGGVHVLDPRLFQANPGLDLPLAAQSLVDLVAQETRDPT